MASILQNLSVLTVEMRCIIYFLHLVLPKKKIVMLLAFEPKQTHFQILPLTLFLKNRGFAGTKGRLPITHSSVPFSAEKQLQLEFDNS